MEAMRVVGLTSSSDGQRDGDPPPAGISPAAADDLAARRWRSGRWWRASGRARHAGVAERRGVLGTGAWWRRLVCFLLSGSVRAVGAFLSRAAGLGGVVLCCWAQEWVVCLFWSAE
jgi:hypothetical protein